MDRSLSCAALEIERDGVDLKHLPDVADRVRWLRPEEAAVAPEVLVVSGVWVWSNVKAAIEVFNRRPATELHTVIVPRHRPGNWLPLLRTPVDVEAVAAEFRSFEWGAEHYGIPGFTVFHTSLHAGKWADAPGVGTVIYGWRPHAAAGSIVLCSALLPGRALGVAVSVQRGLLARILDAVGATCKEEEASIEAEPTKAPGSIGAFLDQERDEGAALLLGYLLCAEPSPDTIVAAARDHLGIGLDAGRISQMLLRLPKTGAEEIIEVLRIRGWGAYLRRLPLSAPQERSDTL